MKKVRLTESDLTRLVNKIISEQSAPQAPPIPEGIKLCSQTGVSIMKDAVEYNVLSYMVPSRGYFVFIDKKGKGCLATKEQAIQILS